MARSKPNTSMETGRRSGRRYLISLIPPLQAEHKPGKRKLFSSVTEQTKQPKQQKPSRKSARLETIQHLQKPHDSFISLQTSKTPRKENSPIDLTSSPAATMEFQRSSFEKAGPQQTHLPQAKNKKRKLEQTSSDQSGFGDRRARSVAPPAPGSDESLVIGSKHGLEHSLLLKPRDPSPTRAPTSLAVPAIDTSEPKADSIEHWVHEGGWPVGYSEPENRSLARRARSVPRDDQSESSYNTPSDQRSRQEKGEVYAHSAYEVLLETKGSYLVNSVVGITAGCEAECRALFTTEQQVPQLSIFNDDLFDEAYEILRTKNEARIIRDITPLICPSAELQALYDNVQPKVLIDSVNEGWNKAITITGTRPQPDYSVGFRRSAFTSVQLKKLEPFVGSAFDFSLIMATHYMYFPFFTCEVKGPDKSLDVADRQNAHSMTIAVKAVVELFRYVRRERELHQEIVAFSISHDCQTVRIYGHYAFVHERSFTFYRHQLDRFDITADRGQRRWTAYKFTQNLYAHWMPMHLRRILSAIDDISPPPDFRVAPLDFAPSVGSPRSRSDGAAGAAGAAIENTPKDLLRQEIQELTVKLNERDEQFMQQVNQLRVLQKYQVDEQREEMERHVSKQKGKMERRVKEQKAQMKRQANQQREQLERQVRALKREKNEIVNVLRQSLK